MNLREYAEIVTSSNTLIEAYANLQEAKDYKYKAKVGNLWLTGKSLKNDKSKGDEFESETEPRQRVNQLKKDGKISKNSKVSILKIEEAVRRFNEADKSRFIKPLFAKYGKNYATRINLANELDMEPDELPSEEAIIKWVNSGAADNCKFDWQKSDNRDFFKELIRRYINYNNNKVNNNARTNPRKLFSDKEHYHIVDENEDWLFVSPLTYESAVFMDSFRCGGAGAKWCIGYERNNKYWNSYVHDKESEFILAYNKKSWGKSEGQKYMIQKEKDGHILTWPQNDDPDQTLQCYESDMLFKTSVEHLFFKLDPIWKERMEDGTVNEIHLNDIPDRFCIGSNIVQLIIDDYPEKTSINIYDILNHAAEKPGSDTYFTVDLGDKYSEFYSISMLPVEHIDDRIGFPQQKTPALCFEEAEGMSIDTIYLDGEMGDMGSLIFHNCGTIHVENLFISNSTWLPDTFDIRDIAGKFIRIQGNTQLFVDNLYFHGHYTEIIDDWAYAQGTGGNCFETVRTLNGRLQKECLQYRNAYIDMKEYRDSDGDCDLNEFLDIPDHMDKVHICIANAIGDYKILPLDKPGVSATYRFKNCHFANKDTDSFVRA